MKTIYKILIKVVVFVYQMSLTSDQVPNVLHVMRGIYPAEFADWDSFVSRVSVYKKFGLTIGLTTLNL